jgi:hypothetical protein
MMTVKGVGMAFRSGIFLSTLAVIEVAFLPMNLRAFSCEPGPSIESHRADLDILIQRAREILPGFEPRSADAIEGARRISRPPYRPNHFFFKRAHAEQTPGGDPECLAAGDRISKALAEALGWQFRFRPEQLNQIGWAFSYATPEGLTNNNFSDELYSDAGMDGAPFGVWIYDPQNVAPFCLLVSKESPSQAVCMDPSEDVPEKANSLVGLGSAVIHEIGGNSLVNVPSAAVHGRGKSNEEVARPNVGELIERFSFRIAVE